MMADRLQARQRCGMVDHIPEHPSHIVSNPHRWRPAGIGLCASFKDEQFIFPAFLSYATHIDVYSKHISNLPTCLIKQCFPSFSFFILDRVSDNQKVAHPHIKCACLLSQFHLSFVTGSTQRTPVCFYTGQQSERGRVKQHLHSYI